MKKAASTLFAGGFFCILCYMLFQVPVFEVIALFHL